MKKEPYVRISIDFILNSQIEGCTKMMVIAEYAYNRIDDPHGYSKRFPNCSQLAESLDLCYQTVSSKRKSDVYKQHSPKFGSKAVRHSPSLKVPYKLITSPYVSLYEKLTLLCIMGHRAQDEDNLTMEQIGEELSISRIYVNKHIGSLIGKQLLSKQVYPAANAGRRGNTYSLSADLLNSLALLEAKDLLQAFSKAKKIKTVYTLSGVQAPKILKLFTHFRL